MHYQFIPIFYTLDPPRLHILILTLTRSHSAFAYPSFSRVRASVRVCVCAFIFALALALISAHFNISDKRTSIVFSSGIYVRTFIVQSQRPSFNHRICLNYELVVCLKCIYAVVLPLFPSPLPPPHHSLPLCVCVWFRNSTHSFTLSIESYYYYIPGMTTTMKMSTATMTTMLAVAAAQQQYWWRGLFSMYSITIPIKQHNVHLD